MKYSTSDSEDEILPNLLQLKTSQEIALSEFEGFLRAEIIFTEKLNSQTRITLKYILDLHKEALKHLYTFARKLRDVNLSKGGFPFAAAKYLPDTMKTFEREILSELKSSYKSKDDLIRDIGIVHGELLLIHPFREGNGRTARIIANLMARKAGYDGLQFDRVGKKEFAQYVSAVQSCADKNYAPMVQFIRAIFPD